MTGTVLGVVWGVTLWVSITAAALFLVRDHHVDRRRRRRHQARRLPNARCHLRDGRALSGLQMSQRWVERQRVNSQEG